MVNTASVLVEPKQQASDRNRPSASSIKEAMKQPIPKGKRRSSVRIQLTLKPEFAKVLDDLRVATDSPTYSDVIRDAMRWYKFVVEAEKSGRPIFSREEDGTLVRLRC